MRSLGLALCLLWPAAALAEPVDLARPTAVLYAEGWDASQGGRCADAVEPLQEVLRRDPQHPTARPLLGACLQSLGRNAEADRILAGGPPPGDPTPVPGGGGRGWARRLAEGAPEQELRPPSSYEATPGAEPRQELRPPADYVPAPGAEPPQELRQPTDYPPPGSSAPDGTAGPAVAIPSEGAAEPPVAGAPEQHLRAPGEYPLAAGVGPVAPSPGPGSGAPLAPEPPQDLRDPESYGAVHGEPCIPDLPRNDRMIDVGGHLSGPSVGLGGVLGVRPHRAVALRGTLGIGLAGLPPQGAFVVGWEAVALPLPWRLTPVVGAGLALATGPGVWWLDGVARPLASAAKARLYGYAQLGARYDARGAPLWIELVVGLAPGVPSWLPLVPAPSLRLGWRLGGPVRR